MNKDKNKTNEILLTKDKFNQYKHKFFKNLIYKAENFVSKKRKQK